MSNNSLYTNDGDGSFSKVISGAVVTDGDSSRGCAWGDYDNDGDLDLFVSNADQNNFLYTNNGDGSFSKVISGEVVTDVGDSFGCAWSDYDNDGDLDLFVSNLTGNNYLYTNDGDGSFTKVISGEVVTDGGASHACAWGDYDNDGDLDLFVSNFAMSNNSLYTNDGDGSFSKVISGAVVTDGDSSRGCAWGDYDNDGDLDLFVSNDGQNNFLYTNNGNGNNWLNIKCVGIASNISAIGAKVKVLATIGGSTISQLREISGGTYSQDSLNAEFGLGDATSIAEIQVYWTNGQLTNMTSVTPNQYLVITEPALPAPTVSNVSPSLGTNENPAFPISVTGFGFYNGASVELNFDGTDPIPATTVDFINSTRLDCVFDLTQASDHFGEAWDVKVTNPGGQATTLEDCFTLDVGVELTGIILYNGNPITIETDAEAVFWISGVPNPTTAYDNSTGAYSIYLPPGDHSINVYFDAAALFDGDYFPYDFHGYNYAVNIPSGVSIVNQDLNCQLLIHLTSPIDNSIAQQWPGPIYDEYANAAFFDWDDVPTTNNYIIDVYTYQSDTYLYKGHPVAGLSTPSSNYNCNLPANLANQHYQIEIKAYNGGAWIGKYMTVYTSGYGGDYRFRITTTSLPPSQVSLMGRSNFGAGYLHTLFLESQDSGGSPANVTVDTVFNLSSDSTGIYTFFSDSGGTIPITQVTIPTGQNRVYFFYLDDLPGTPSITASWASGGADLESSDEQPLIWAVTGQIVFQSDRDGNEEVYIMNADGTGQWKITNNLVTDGHPDWSHTGSHVVFMSDFDGDSEIFKMRADGSRREKLTDNDSADVFPCFSPDGSKIAFASNRDTNFEIYVMNADGSGQTNISSNSALDYLPCWSPDGNKIVFRSDRDGDFEIYVMDADGSNQTRLTDNPAADNNPDWSPDGSKIAFSSDRNGNNEIYVMDTDGTNQVNLTNNSGGDWGPSWSPDGSRISFHSLRDGNREVYIMNADGSGQTNLSQDPGEDKYSSWGGSKIVFSSFNAGDNDIYIMDTEGVGRTNLTNNGIGESNPFWSPDGTKIGFNRSSNIWKMNSDGTGETQLTSASNDLWASWSPDGSKIAFSRVVGGKYDIFVMDADGTNQTNLTNDSGSLDYWPSWSPYGSKIVFQKRLTGPNDEIFVMNSDGSLQTNLTNSGAYDAEPSWSPNGEKIAFARNQDIYTMDTDGTNVTQLTSSGDYEKPEWSADGRKIVFYRAGFNDIYVMNADGTDQTNISNSSPDYKPDWRPQARIINPSYEYVSQWGSVGTGDNEFGAPEYITVDSSGNVYVSETDNHRVSKYTSDGTLLGWWGKGSSTTGWHAPNSGETARNSGHGDGELNNPRGIAIDSSGDVYVGVTFRVCKFTSTGTFLGWWGYGWKDVVGSYVGWFDPESGYTPRSGRIVDGGFGAVFGIAIDSSDNIYAVGGTFVQKSQFNGGTYEFLGWWGLDGDGFTGWHDPGALKSSAGGIWDGQFYYARDVAVDSSGYVYVTDGHPEQQRVQKFANDGTFIGWWGQDTTGETGWHAPGSGRTGAIGEGDGQFYNPYGIAIDNSGLVYVINSWRPRFQVFTSDGTFIGWMGKDNSGWTGWHIPGTGTTGNAGSGDGQFSSPFGIVVDPSGNVYVTDGGNSRIQKFRKIER